MNGTTSAPAARSVQLAVMAAPSASVAEAVAEARRRPTVDAVHRGTEKHPAARLTARFAD